MPPLNEQPARPVPKPKHKRRVRKRGNASKYSTAVRLTIIERDKGFCVRCGALYDDIHHIIFRSAGGKGTVDNGVCVCRRCHAWAHSCREGREWFERYREERLLT